MSRQNSLKPCPVCSAPALPGYAPFCSRGCKDRDLLRWLGEGYAIPGRPAEIDDAEGLDRREPGPL